MSSPITIEVGIKSCETAWLDAPPAMAHRLLDAIDSLRLWDHQVGCWKFPQRRVDDLIAHAKTKRQRITVVEVDR